MPHPTRGRPIRSVLATVVAALIALVLAPAIVLSSPSPAFADAALNPSQFKGLVWSRIGDNGITGPLLLQGLSDSDDYATTKTKALDIIQGFKDIGANTVRLPVNPATVTEPYWTKYRGAIDAALEKGFKVDLSYWIEDPSGRVPNATTWNKMWDDITAAYVSNPLVYYNPIQEPFGYSEGGNNYQEYRDLMAKWMTDRPQVPKSHIFFAGAIWNHDVNPLCSDSRFDGSYLALHRYVWYGTGEWWVGALKQQLGSCASHVIMEEFGTDMNTGLDYNNPDSTDAQVQFLRSAADTIRQLGLGAIWCHGIGGRDLAVDASGHFDTLNILRLKNDTTNTPMWVPNPSGLQRLQYAWGMGPTERIEAETGQLLGGAGVESHSNASGGQNVGFMASVGDGVSFSNVNAVNRLDIGYASPTTGTFSLYINGVKNQAVSFPATGGWNTFAHKGVNVTIPAGATVALKHDTGDMTMNVDYITQVPAVRVEGETGTLLGGAQVEPHSNASNGQNVGFMTTTGAGVSYTNLNATDKLDIGYAAASAGTFSLYVNNVKDQAISFPATGGWNTFAKKTVDVTIPAGATVTLKRDATDTAINVDYLDEVPSVRFEAERGTLLGGAQVGTYYSSASNGSNVGATFNVGDGVAISNLNAANRIVIGYAANATGTFSLYINDVKNQTITFPATGWGNWAKKAVNVTIPAGAKISLKHDTGDGTIDIDYIDQ